MLADYYLKELDKLWENMDSRIIMTSNRNNLKYLYGLLV